MKYVDVNIFIYWLNNHPLFGETATNIIARIDSGEKAITSALTPWLVHVVFKKLQVEKYSYHDLICRLDSIMNLEFVPLDNEIYIKASKVATQHGLDIEDAIHLATAIDHKAQAIYSNDSDFDMGPMKRLFG